MIASLALLALPSIVTPKPVPPKVALQILSIEKDGTVDALPYVSPELAFTSSGTKVTPKEIVFCTVSERRTSFADHADSFVTLSCEGGEKLTLTGVDFGQ